MYDSRYLLSKLSTELKLPFDSCEKLKGDGSTRDYYRLKSKNFAPETLICMLLNSSDKLALQNNTYPWVAVADTFNQWNIPYPKILARANKTGCLLLEDCGNDDLHKIINKHKKNPERQNALFLKATEYIAKFLKISKNSNNIWEEKSFDYKKLKDELDFFQTNYLNLLYPKLLSDNEKSVLTEEIDLLCKKVSSRPFYFTHRDYHSKNILYQNKKTYVIDFQDAMLGPAAYDLVSLIFDSYLDLTYKRRQILFKNSMTYLRQELELKIVEEIENTWQVVLLQRLLKALGSFAYLTLVAKKGDYLLHEKKALKIIQKSQEKSKFVFLAQHLPHKILSQKKQRKGS